MIDDKPHVRIEIGKTIGDTSQHCKVLVDGQEVPVSDIEINASSNALTEAKITLLPDEVVKAEPQDE